MLFLRLSMKIITWNVNSIRARLTNLESVLSAHTPDVVLLQETKTQNETFPLEQLEDLGYNVAIHGQKTFNGVAILSRFPLEDITCGLPTFAHDPQARYIEAVVKNVRVSSVYVPNGQSLDSDKYLYKMDFLSRLREHLSKLLSYNEAIVVGGDYNIAPCNDDVHDPEKWKDDILCSPPERKHFYSLLNLGYFDALRLKTPPPGPFTWWDYRRGAWQKNEGLRIDHLLLSPMAADWLDDAGVDSHIRDQDKASDHAPVWCTLTPS